MEHEMRLAVLDWRMHITKFNLRERAEGAIDLLLEARAGDEGA